MQLGFIFALIISILVAIFAIQNGDIVTIDLFLAKYQISQAIVILVSVISGAVIAMILGSFRQIKKYTLTKELKNKVKVLETEKEELQKNYDSFAQTNKTIIAEKSQLEEKITQMNEVINNQLQEINTLKTESAVIVDASSNNINEESQTNS